MIIIKHICSFHPVNKIDWSICINKVDWSTCIEKKPQICLIIEISPRKHYIYKRMIMFWNDQCVQSKWMRRARPLFF